MLTRYSSLFTFLIIVLPIQQSALIGHFDFDMLVRSGSPLRTRKKLQPSARKQIAVAPVISYPYPKGLASERNGPPLHAGYSRRSCPTSYLMVNDLGKQREKFN